MGYFSKLVGVCAAVTLLSVAVVGAEEKDPLKPRVAPDQMADAKAMKNPVASTPESIAKGKALYEGKGTCFNCHGKAGDGQGEAGKRRAGGQIDTAHRRCTVGRSWHLVTDDARYRRPVDTSHRHRPGHRHPVAHPIHRTRPSLIYAAVDPHQGPRQCRRVHGILDIRCCCGPGQIWRHRIRATQVHIPNRGRGIQRPSERARQALARH